MYHEKADTLRSINKKVKKVGRSFQKLVERRNLGNGKSKKVE
jgi:hypothetical protein